MLSNPGGWEKKDSDVLNHVLNSSNSGQMKIRGTDLAEASPLWPEMAWHTSDKLTMLWWEKTSSLLHFNGFHLYRVGVTASNTTKAFAICPPLVGFQMSGHQPISMAPTLGGGGNLDTNILIIHSLCRLAATLVAAFAIRSSRDCKNRFPMPLCHLSGCLST